MRPSRRGTRRNAEPITTVEQFEDCIFAGTEFALSLYIDLLRGPLPAATESACVFTHGDIQPAHIMAKHDDDSGWVVAAIIDWEGSRFYSGYWEAIKMTNNLVSSDGYD